MKPYRRKVLLIFQQSAGKTKQNKTTRNMFYSIIAKSIGYIMNTDLKSHLKKKS